MPLGRRGTIGDKVSVEMMERRGAIWCSGLSGLSRRGCFEDLSGRAKDRLGVWVDEEDRVRRQVKTPSFGRTGGWWERVDAVADRCWFGARVRSDRGLRCEVARPTRARKSQREAGRSQGTKFEKSFDNYTMALAAAAVAVIAFRGSGYNGRKH